VARLFLLPLKKTAVMRMILCLLLANLLVTTSFGQSADEKAIRKILYEQTLAWNRGDLDEFMKGYWNNDSLMFIGKSGVTYGYQNTLMNYKKNYRNADEMGTLLFNLVKVQRLSPEYYFVVGKWNLKRNAGDIGGHYNLLFRKVKGQWVIVADHSS
jgi:ketosteroid isomerase-like protein